MKKLLAFAFALLYACQSAPRQEELPILGWREAQETMIDGKLVIDTVYHQIADFAFFNQDSTLVTGETFAGKIYVTDFFFTTCPTICPIMQNQLLRVYERFKEEPSVMILSHTIDPARDTVGKLREYAANMGVSSEKWHFVTGEQEAIYNMAQYSYMVTAMEDAAAEGGFYHNGYFILIDQQKRIRGVYDGTDKESVDKLMADIPKLVASVKDSVILTNSSI
jgi:protein SCO1/2